MVTADYARAYAALARRVSAACAYLDAELNVAAKTELRAAMEVINYVENPIMVIDGNRST